MCSMTRLRSPDSLSCSTGRRREGVPMVCSSHGSSVSSIAAFRPSVTTFTLLAVSFYLIATTLPVTICYVLYLRFPKGDPAVPQSQRYADAAWSSHYNYRVVRMVVEEFSMSHYACNFFIYMATGRCFRRELRRLVTKLVPCRRDLSHGDWSS